jgi:hypothetical protein
VHDAHILQHGVSIVGLRGVSRRGHRRIGMEMELRTIMVFPLGVWICASIRIPSLINDCGVYLPSYPYPWVPKTVILR